MDNTPRYGDSDNTLLKKIAGLLDAGGGGGGAGVGSFNGRTGVVTLTSPDVVTALGYTPANGALYVLKTGDSMSGDLDVAGLLTTVLASGRIDFNASMTFGGTAPTMYGSANRNIRFGQDPASGGGYLRFYGGTAGGGNAGKVQLFLGSGDFNWTFQNGVSGMSVEASTDNVRFNLAGQFIINPELGAQINTGTVLVDTPALYITQTVQDDGSAEFAAIRADAANVSEDENFSFIRFRFNAGGSGLTDVFSVGQGGQVTAAGTIQALALVSTQSVNLTGAAATLSIGDNSGAVSSIRANTLPVMNVKSLAAVPYLSFFAVAPVIKQTSGANLTNNVTSGGTDNQIDNFTSLTVYSTDAAAIRNNIYQLARKLKQVNDALRLYGLLT